MDPRAAALAFDLKRLDGAFLADPFPLYRALREHDPVHRMPDGSYSYGSRLSPQGGRVGWRHPIQLQASAASARQRDAVAQISLRTHAADGGAAQRAALLGIEIGAGVHGRQI